MLNFNVNTLNGANGFAIPGLQYGDDFGNSIKIGDLNNDGLGDIVVGAPGFNNNRGLISVIFGSRELFPASFDINNLDGRNGFIINSTTVDLSIGASVTIGDYDCNGFKDLAFSGPYQNISSQLTSAGSVYVLLNQGDSYAPYYDVYNTSSIIEIDGIYPFESLGSVSRSLETIDFNNDGCEDLVIGAPSYSNNAGMVYTLFGNPEFGETTLSNLNGTNGFAFEAAKFNSQVGYTVANLGDVNNDQIEDLAIGAPEYQSTGGNIYVVFGGQETPVVMTPTELDGKTGFTILANGSPSYSWFGTSIAASDINNDGLNDIVFSCNNGQTFAGFVYGRNTTVFPEQINMNQQENSVCGFFSGEGSYIQSIASGNFSSTEFSDLIFGFGNRGKSEAFVVEDQIFNNPGNVNIANLDSLVEIAGNLCAGYGYLYGGGATSIGDINGDMFEDVVLSYLSEAPSWSLCGEGVYIIFGSPLL